MNSIIDSIFGNQKTSLDNEIDMLISDGISSATDDVELFGMLEYPSFSQSDEFLSKVYDVNSLNNFASVQPLEFSIPVLFGDSGFGPFSDPGYQRGLAGYFSEYSENNESYDVMGCHDRTIRNQDGCSSNHFSLNEFMGTEPGDIFTLGGSGGAGFGGAFSFDRVILSDGKPDWFFTFGFGAVTPGASLGFDRGKVFQLDLINPDHNPLEKKEVKGWSGSGNVDLPVVGGEVIVAPFPSGNINGVTYPSPTITPKRGLRIGSPGANILLNYTIDIGE